MKLLKFLSIRKRRVTACIMAVCLMLTMMPVMSVTTYADGSHTCNDVVYDTEWSGSMTATTLTVDSNIVLTDATTFSGNIIIGDGSGSCTVNICLNGKGLEMGDNFIEVNENATLNIYDCGTTGVITGNSGAIVNEGTVNIFSGTISFKSNGSHTIDNNGILKISGGRVENIGSANHTVKNSESGTSTISGGVVYGTGNHTVYNEGTMVISDGTIENAGSAYYSVFNCGTLNITGGTVTRAKDYYYTLGNEGTMTISGGVIENTGGFGAVYNKSKATITGGTVTSSYDETVMNQGIFNVEGGTVENTGSGYAISASGSMGSIAATYIYSNPTVSGGTDSADVYLDNNYTKLYGAKDNDAYSGEKIDIDYDISKFVNGSIVVYDSNDTERFAVTVSGYKLKVDSSDTNLILAETVSHTHNDITFDNKWTSVNGTVETTGNYYLSEDLTATGNIIIGNGTDNCAVDLCLNGKALDMGNYYITVSANATLNIYDCGTTGKISGNGTYIISNGGTTVVLGGIIENTGSTGDTVDNSGGLIVSGGTVTGNGTYVVNNSGNFDVNGGAVTGDVSSFTVKNDGTMNVSGGTVTGNCSYAIQNTDTLTVSGGEITNTNGGGIKNEGVVSISGGKVTCTTTGAYTTIFNEGDVTVSDGTVSGNGITNFCGTVEISGGTVTGDDDATIDNNGGTVNVSGGTVENTGSGYAISAYGEVDVEAYVYLSNAPSIVGGTDSVDVYLYGVDAKLYGANNGITYEGEQITIGYLEDEFEKGSVVVYDSVETAKFVIDTTEYILKVSGANLVLGVEEDISDVIYGDVNNDGAVDGRDIVRINKYLSNYNSDTQTSTVEIGPGADANGDGVVDGRDVVRLCKYIANLDYSTGNSTVTLGGSN